MAVVSVRINGRDYNLACDDGQEEQLVALSQEVDDRVRQIARQAPHAGEVMLFLLSSVMLADELADTRRQVRQMHGKLMRLEEQFHAGGITPVSDEELELKNQDYLSQERAKLAESEAAMTETLLEVAARIEKIAAQLEME